MANRFGDEVTTAAPAPPVSRFGDAPAQAGDSREGWTAQLGDFGGHLWDSLTSIPKGIGQTLQHPLDTANAVLDQTKHSLTRVKEEWDKGNKSDALANLVTAIPVAGPILTQGGNELQQGKYGAAAGDAGGLYLGAKLPGLAAKLPGAAVEVGSQVAAKAADLAAPVAAAAKAAVPGLVKMGAGAAVDALPLPEMAKYAIGAPTVLSGARQAARGASRGFTAARDAAAADEVASLPVRPTPAPPAAGAVPMDLTVTPETGSLKPDWQRSVMRPTDLERSGPVIPERQMDPATAAPAPTGPRTVSHADSIKPNIAKTLVEGDMRTLPDGSTQVLRRVPLDLVDADPGNTIYPDKVEEYRKTPSPLHAELKDNPETPGAYVIKEGHHRLMAADVSSGKTPPVWVPQDAAPAAAAPTSAPAAVHPGQAAYEAEAARMKANLAAMPESPGKAAFDAKAAQPAYGAATETIGKVADHLEANKTTAAAAAKLNPGEWDKIAKDAGVGSLSPKATTQVITELRARANPQSKTLAPSAEYAAILAKNPKAAAAAKAMAEGIQP